MRIFLTYENSKRDFNGRLLLATQLIKKNEIDEVHIGWHKDIFFELFKSIFFYKGKTIIIDCNNYDYKFPFIKLLKFFNCDYYVIDEEEIGISYLKNDKIVKLRFLSKEFTSLIDGKFVLGEKNYQIAKKFMSKSVDKIYQTGHPRVDFIKHVIKNKKILNENFEIKKNFILVCLPENLFRSFLLLLQIKKNPKKGELAIKNFDFRKGRYKYVREFLMNLKKIAKINPDKNFILRVHPTDKEYEKKYKFYFKDISNISINTNYNALYFILQSDFLICGLDFIAAESHLMKKKSISFLGDVFNYAKDYKGHFGSNLSNLEYCNNFEEFEKTFNKFKNLENNIDNSEINKDIIDLLSFDKDASKDIASIIYKKSFNDKKISLKDKIIRGILKYSLKDIFQYLSLLKKKNFDKIEAQDLSKLINRYKYSPKKVIYSILISRIFLSCLYKCLFYSNFKDHSAYRMSGQQQKIEIDDFNLSLKINRLDSKKFNAHYLKNGFYFLITKK